jgi:hypothetical protein
MVKDGCGEATSVFGGPQFINIATTQVEKKGVSRKAAKSRRKAILDLF